MWLEEGNRLIKFDFDGIFEEILDLDQHWPDATLPPIYHTPDWSDKNRYHERYMLNSSTGSARRDSTDRQGLHLYTGERSGREIRANRSEWSIC